MKPEAPKPTQTELPLDPRLLAYPDHRVEQWLLTYNAAVSGYSRQSLTADYIVRTARDVADATHGPIGVV